MKLAHIVGKRLEQPRSVLQVRQESENISSRIDESFSGDELKYKEIVIGEFVIMTFSVLAAGVHKTATGVYAIIMSRFGPNISLDMTKNSSINFFIQIGSTAADIVAHNTGVTTTEIDVDTSTTGGVNTDCEFHVVVFGVKK